MGNRIGTREIILPLFLTTICLSGCGGDTDKPKSAQVKETQTEKVDTKPKKTDRDRITVKGINLNMSVEENCKKAAEMLKEFGSGGVDPTPNQFDDEVGCAFANGYMWQTNAVVILGESATSPPRIVGLGFQGALFKAEDMDHTSFVKAFNENYIQGEFTPRYNEGKPEYVYNGDGINITIDKNKYVLIKRTPSRSESSFN